MEVLSNSFLWLAALPSYKPAKSEKKNKKKSGDTALELRFSAA